MLFFGGEVILLLLFTARINGLGMIANSACFPIAKGFLASHFFFMLVRKLAAAQNLTYRLGRSCFCRTKSSLRLFSVLPFFFLIFYEDKKLLFNFSWLIVIAPALHCFSSSWTVYHLLKSWCSCSKKAVSFVCINKVRDIFIALLYVVKLNFCG